MPKRQGGAALLLLLMVVVLALSSIVLVNLNTDDVRLRQLAHTQQQLATAKRALLEYAALLPDLQPGQPHGLPCPDIDDGSGYLDGEAHTDACGSPAANVIGRLPWRTLGLPALKDSSEACLWYVVSGSHKVAGPDTVGMINPDSNAQLSVYVAETGAISEGASPNGRPVALIMAGMRPIGSQTRPSANTLTQCTPGALPSQYLDSDLNLGISNAFVSGASDGIDSFVTALETNEQNNDQFISISRIEYADAVQSRRDFDVEMRALGLLLARCVAHYGSSNPAGSTDKRLPWPAPMTLADYRIDGHYDDTNSGITAGRLADWIDDSNALTGNSRGRLLGDCSGTAVPGWTTSTLAKWRNWKDHFFYAVAGSFAPDATTPSGCSSCASINGSGSYAAVVIYAGRRLASLNQGRDAPPLDTDMKQVVSNYLEGLNATSIPGSSAAANLQSQLASATFNDLLFCIDGAMTVTEC